jgi:hypothetical protein
MIMPSSLAEGAPVKGFPRRRGRGVECAGALDVQRVVTCACTAFEDQQAYLQYTLANSCASIGVQVAVARRVYARLTPTKVSLPWASQSSLASTAMTAPSTASVVDTHQE